MPLITRYIFLFICTILTNYCIGQDSLFVSSDRPSLYWEDNPATLGMEYKVSKRGTIKAVKFYKWTSTTNPFTVTVWDTTGALWFTQVVSSSKIGWHRIPCNLLTVPGMKYVIGVYNNDNKYGYRKSVYPRTRGSITATGGRFGYPSSIPKNNGDCYYLDVVFQPDAIPYPKATVIPDSAAYNYGIDSIKITGSVENAISWTWEIIDSLNTSEIKGLNTLSPVFYPKDEGGCSITLMLTATGVDGNQRSAVCDILVYPNPNEAVGIITRSGRVLWLKQIIVTKPFYVYP